MPRDDPTKPKTYSEPLTRYTNYYIAKTLRSIGYYDPERRSWPIIKRMRKYPQIQFGLNLMKWAVLSTPRSVICDTDDPDVKKFIETHFVKPHLTRMLKVNLNALDYGFSPAEVRWELDETITDFSPVGAYTIREMRDPDPQYCYPVIDEYGDYQGFVQKQASGKDIEIEPDVSTWFTFIMEHGRWFGVPWTDACYDAWYKAVLMMTWMAQEAERFGGPFTEVRFPTYEPPEDPRNATNLARAEKLAKETRTDSYIALPSSRDRAGNYHWEILRKIEHATGRDWIEKLNWLQVQMFRALGIPDLVATQTEIGARSLGETHQSMLYMGFDALNEQLDRFITEHLLKKYTTYNIPEPPSVEIVSEKLQDDRREFLMEVYKETVISIVKDEPDGPLARGIIQDLERYGIKPDEERPEDLEDDEPEPPPFPPPDNEEPQAAGEGDVEEE